MVVASDEWWRGSDEPMRWNDNLDAGEVNGDKYKCDKGDGCALADVLTDVLDRLHWMDAKLDLLLTLSRRDTTRQRRASWDRAD